MSADPGPRVEEAGRAAQEAAVIGVVLAGVLASFVIPGPFDWGSTLIGAILLVVLCAYGGVPSGPRAWQRGLGMAAAAAFCWLLILGRPFDNAFKLTQWPKERSGELARRDDARPNPDAGIELGLFWLALFGLCYGGGFAYAKWLRPWIRRRQDRNAKPKPAQIKLADLEREIVTTLKSEGIEPDAVTKDLLKRWDTVCDEGRLQFYTAARYGSAHDSDWISPALVARIQRAVAKERPGAAD
jgi:hypothetical protein